MYTLPGSLTLRNVKSIQDELIGFLKDEREKGGDDGKEVVLDFLHLKDLDMAGLQLLLSMAISFQKYDIHLRVDNLQEPIRELLQLTGAGDILAFDAV